MHIMKKEILFLSILIILTSKTYSQDIAMDESLELANFEQFFKKDNPSVPLDTLYYSNNKNFSLDKSFYIQSILRDKKHRLMTYDDKFIAEIPNASIYDQIIWLRNCVLIKSRINESPPYELNLINLSTGKLMTYTTKERFYYKGNSDSSCYYYSSQDSSYFGDLFVHEEYSIVEINEKGIRLTNVKEREDDNKIIRKYYADSFSFVMNKNTTGKYTYNFHYFDSIWSYNEPIEYFDEKNVYHHNGAYYVKINSKAIYRFDNNNVTKIVDCDTMRIDQFMIENNHLIYSTYYDYQKPLLGIMNLDTRQMYYPTIIKHKD